MGSYQQSLRISTLHLCLYTVIDTSLKEDSEGIVCEWNKKE